MPARASRARSRLGKVTDLEKEVDELQGDWRSSPLPFALPARGLTAAIEEIAAIGRGSERLAPAVAAFASNLAAALDVALVPATVLAAHTGERRSSELDTREVLLRLGRRIGRDLEREPSFEAEALDVLVVFQQLLSAGRNVEVVECVATSLRQATALLWAAFEMVANDLVEVLLNARVELLESGGEFLAALRQSGMKVSSAMQTEFRESSMPGTLFVERYRMQSLRAIERLFACLNPDNESQERVFKSPLLKGLAERRNVIAHRAGIVDERYLRATSDEQTKGTLIEIQPTWFQLATGEVAAAGLILGLVVGSKLGDLLEG